MFGLRRRNPYGSSPTNPNGWMMSYADMATTLLAMFIVLSTLGKDQTGISLYNGTGSFMRSAESFGLPGLFPNSARTIPLEAASPHYPSAQDASPSQKRTSGPDEGAELGRVIDVEEEELQQFLASMKRQFEVDKQAPVSGAAVVDLYERLGRQPPLLTGRNAGVLGQVVAALQRPNFKVQIIVWATMPSEKAWLRVAQQAHQIADEIAALARLDDTGRSRLIALGKPWRHPDIPRPVVSFLIERVHDSAE